MMRVKVGENKVYVVRYFNQFCNLEEMEKFAFFQTSPGIYKLICLGTQNRWDDKEYARGDVVDIEEELHGTIFAKFSMTVEAPYQ